MDIKMEIDAAMMGVNWSGDSDDLREFGDILERENANLGLSVTVITDSGNGAASTGDPWLEGIDWNGPIEIVSVSRPWTFALGAPTFDSN